MHHGIDREWQFQTHNLGRERTFARESAFVAGDVVRARGLAVLD
jgi:hypothetical protein